MNLRLCYLTLLLVSLLVAWPQGPVAAQSELPGPGANGAATAGQQAESNISREQISYALGLNIGSDLRADEVEIDLSSIAAGIADGFKGNEPKWSEQECAAALQQFQREMQMKLRAQHQEYAVRNQRQADSFLAQNKQREGVVETASGLQYEVLAAGNGPSPTRSDTVRVHYRGTLLDGTEFDSSLRGQPIEFPVGNVISGWTEALQKMHVGDKWRLFIPPNLAYGARPPGPPIEPNSLLVFEVELLGIVE